MFSDAPVILACTCQCIVIMSRVSFRFMKRVCRALGLLQEASSVQDAEDDSSRNSGTGRRPSRTGRALVQPTAAEVLLSRVPAAKQRHRLVGGMDVLQHSTPFIGDVLQVVLYCHGIPAHMCTIARTYYRAVLSVAFAHVMFITVGYLSFGPIIQCTVYARDNFFQWVQVLIWYPAVS